MASLTILKLTRGLLTIHTLATEALPTGAFFSEQSNSADDYKTTKALTIKALNYQSVIMKTLNTEALSYQGVKLFSR